MLQNYRLSEIISTTYLIKIVKWWIIDDYFAIFVSKIRRNPTKNELMLLRIIQIILGSFVLL